MPNYQPATHDVGVSRTFAALADPTRRAIVARLVGGPLAVSQLAEPLPMALPSVMQHLGVLEAVGLIRTEKHGRVRTCQIDPTPLREAERWLIEQRTAWETRLDALADTLSTPSRRST